MFWIIFVFIWRESLKGKIPFWCVCVSNSPVSVAVVILYSSANFLCTELSQQRPLLSIKLSSLPPSNSCQDLCSLSPVRQTVDISSFLQLSSLLALSDSYPLLFLLWTAVIMSTFLLTAVIISYFLPRAPFSTAVIISFSLEQLPQSLSSFQQLSSSLSFQGPPLQQLSLSLPPSSSFHNVFLPFKQLSSFLPPLREPPF